MTDDADQRSTAASFAHTPRRVGLSRFERLVAHLGGVNPDRLERGPLDDRQAAARTGLALTTSVLFVSYASANALAIAFGDSRAAFLVGLPAAALIAASIGFVDHAMIQSHWWEAGFSAARRRGFGHAEASGPLATLRRAGGVLTVGAVRVGLSASLAFSIATVMELQIFHSDIAAQMTADQRAANAPILPRAQSAVEAGIAAAAAIAADRDARIAQLQQQYDRSDERAYAARRTRTGETYGELIDGACTGKAGRGPAYRFADDDARLATERAAELAAAIASLRQSPPSPPADAGALDTAHAEVALLRAAHDKAEAERRQRAGARAADIQAALAADPAYVPLADGLVTRLGAMRELEASPAVFALTTAIKALLMMVEMAGLICKLLLAAPGRYGLFQALDFESDAAEAIEAAAERIDALEEGADRREERWETRDSRRRRRYVAAGARKRFASVLRDAMDGTDRP